MSQRQKKQVGIGKFMRKSASGNGSLFQVREADGNEHHED